MVLAPFLSILRPAFLSVNSGIGADSYSTEKMNEYIEKLSDYEGKIIYHYTSPDALLSILDKEMIVLRFTRADCLNDKTEGKDLEKYYKQACEELRQQCAVSDDVYQFISSIGFEDTYTFFSQDGKTVRNEPTDIYLLPFLWKGLTCYVELLLKREQI